MTRARGQMRSARGQIFRNRREAGKVLADLLGAYRGRENVIVLGLPRGGYPSRGKWPPPLAPRWMHSLSASLVRPDTMSSRWAHWQAADGSSSTTFFAHCALPPATPRCRRT